MHLLYIHGPWVYNGATSRAFKFLSCIVADYTLMTYHMTTTVFVYFLLRDHEREG